jgi:hypothetical protein
MNITSIVIDALLRNAILKRSARTPLEKALIRGMALLGKDKLQSIWDPLGPLIEHRRVTISAFSDIEPNLSLQYTWGDYWFKAELTKAIGALGFAVVAPSYPPDVVLHIFGHPTDLSRFESAFKILWIHSHPEKVTPSILAQYDRVTCISDTFAAEVQKMGFHCNVVQQGTSKRSVPGLPLRYDVVFVGNARSELRGTRQIVADMGLPDYDFKVWGSGYCELPTRYWAGMYIDNGDLGTLYSTSRISLNDHRPAMAAAGFINPRVFDILAAGGFCVSDPNPAITDLFGDTVPQYTSPAHLRELVTYYLDHPEERQALAGRGHAIAIQYTWEKVAAALLEGIPQADGG